MKILLFVLCLSVAFSFILKNGENTSIIQSKEVSVSNLTIYLIPHSHDDVGWLKTPDNYFYGDDQQTQWAGVQYTLDNVITQLTVNERLKFSVVEIAFVDMWWRRANQSIKNQMIGHVKSGKIQFLNAGWCMSDQATVYYQDVIDQMTIGLKWVKQKFGVVPNVAWQIDPFGHQASFATLGHQMGFDSIFFSRIHHQDKALRKKNKGMQLIWRPPQASRNEDSILAHVNYYFYNPPPGFCFDQTCRDQPIKSDPTLEGYNIDIKAEQFVEYFRNMSKSYQSNNLFHTLGSDFQWSNARMWTMNMDKLMAYIHNHSQFGLTVKYATPSQYIKAIYQQGITFPTKTDDFFPYADYNNSYWSGYFTSRVGIKGFVRDTGRWLQSIRTKIALLKLSDTSPYLNTHKDDTEKFILQMQKQMGILQHHDAVSGTQKQKVANQYIRVANKARIALAQFYNNIIKQQTNHVIGQTPEQIFQTHWNQTQNQWGISQSLAANKNVLLHLYNPGPENNYQIKIKIDSRNLNIIDSNNNTIKGDIICGNTKDSHDCELFFTIKLSQTSWGYVKLQPSSSSGSASIIQMSQLTIIAPTKQIKLSQTASVKIHRNDQKFQLSLPSGSHAFSLAYNYYQSFQDVTQKSGAYIFRPSAATKTSPKKYSNLKNLHYSDGHQMLVISMLEDKTYTKLYFSKIPGHVDSFGVEIETFIDSINVADHQGKQIVLGISTGVNNNKIFYTDSNGLDEQKRVLNSMPTYNITVDQPVASNYYPLNSHIKINDSSKVVSVIVDRARGGAVIKDGVIELMLHRRTIFDDVRGVWQPLNETQVGDKGLTQLVRNYILFGNNNRQLQKRLDQAILITWSNSNGPLFNKNQPKNVVFNVPKQSKLWLRSNPDNSYLLRVQFLDTLNLSSSSIQIPQGYEITQLTLGANQLLSQWKQKQLKWKSSSSEIQTHDKKPHAKLLKKLTSHSANQIQLKPLQIRTFQLTK